MMNGGSSANCLALKFGIFSLPDNGKAVAISDQENKLFSNNETSILVRWITAERAGKLEAQRPALRLFGKVSFQAACKCKNLCVHYQDSHPALFIFILQNTRSETTRVLSAKLIFFN